MQSQCAYLKFVKNFLELRNDVRKFLRLRSYSEMMECYERLKRVPEEFVEVFALFYFNS